MKKKTKIQLHDVPVILMNEFPSCQSECPHKGICANHRTANNFRQDQGATPDLKQVVKGSWRCHQSPKEKLKGAILVNGEFLSDRINGPDWDDTNDYDGWDYGFDTPSYF